MERIYSLTELAKAIGVTTETIRNWEKARVIPIAARIGRRRSRVFSEWKVKRIFEFAESIGYKVRGAK